MDQANGFVQRHRPSRWRKSATVAKPAWACPSTSVLRSAILQPIEPHEPGTRGITVRPPAIPSIAPVQLAQIWMIRFSGSPSAAAITAFDSTEPRTIWIVGQKPAEPESRRGRQVEGSSFAPQPAFSGHPQNRPRAAALQPPRCVRSSADLRPAGLDCLPRAYHSRRALPIEISRRQRQESRETQDCYAASHHKGWGVRI